MGVPIIDGLRNIVANLGTDRDKRAHSTYITVEQNDQQLIAMYRSSAVARKIVDLPAEDATREWREWQAQSDQIEKIEAEENRLGLQGKVLKAKKRARLFGGSAIYIGIRGDMDTSEPLDPTRVGLGDIAYLTVLNKSDISAGQLQRDPREEGFGKPVEYTVTTETQGQLQIHPSRLVVLHGEELPDERQAGLNYGWGDSSLLSCLSNVTDLDATIGNIASLIFEAKVDVIGIEGFNDGLRNGGKAYEDLVITRASLAARGKGINGALLKDMNDSYEQKSASFSTLPDIMDRFMQMVSAASGIPMTILFGQSPGGMNATGESDTRGYYDRVKVLQTLEMAPAMSLLDECLIRSAIGNRPDDIHYNWRPLWQPTQKEKADTGKVIAETAKIVSETSELPEGVIGKALVNALTESGAFPGLEGAADEFYSESGVEGVVRATDAEPRTLYVHRKVLNASDILDWARDQGFEKTLSADDLHVTIAFSRTPVDWMDMGESWSEEIKVPAGGARIMERFGDARVLLFNSSELAWRHEQMKHAGASWDHAEYQPHITISYDDQSPDLTEVEPYSGEIILGPEVFQEVEEDWLEGVVET